MNERRARATTPPPVQVRIGCENGRGHRGGRAAALGRSGRLALVVVVAHFDEKTFNKQDQIFCFNSEREKASRRPPKNFPPPRSFNTKPISGVKVNERHATLEAKLLMKYISTQTRERALACGAGRYVIRYNQFGQIVESLWRCNLHLHTRTNNWLRSLWTHSSARIHKYCVRLRAAVQSQDIAQHMCVCARGCEGGPEPAHSFPLRPLAAVCALKTNLFAAAAAVVRRWWLCYTNMYDTYIHSGVQKNALIEKKSFFLQQRIKCPIFAVLFWCCVVFVLYCL